MEEVTDKMVQIATFPSEAEAGILQTYLEAEGIICYLRDELTNQIYGSISVMGGIKVDILEKDLPRALELMREGGYELPLPEDYSDGVKEISSFSEQIPFLRKFQLETQIIIIFVIVAVFLALLIAYGTMFA